MLPSLLVNVLITTKLNEAYYRLECLPPSERMH